MKSPIIRFMASERRTQVTAHRPEVRSGLQNQQGRRVNHAKPTNQPPTEQIDKRFGQG